MEQFSQLPIEIQTQVLKEYPNFRRINKEQYKEKYLFDEIYCNLDISVNEFKKYLNTDVESFIIYTIKDEICDIYSCNKIYNQYELFQYTFFIDYEDIDEYIINNDKAVIQSYEGWDDIIGHVLTLDNIYYDIKTVKNIVSQRNCNIQNYTFDYCFNYIKNIMLLPTGDGGDIGHLYNKLFKLLYLTTSYDVITTNNHDFFSDSIDLTFNSEGSTNDQDNYDQTLKHIKYNTKLYLASINKWVHNNL